MSKEIEINEILAVLQSDLKKLIKHFRLDRRKQGEEDAPVIAENATPDNETLHRIEATLKELSERSTISDERLNKIINGAGEYLYQKQRDNLTVLKPVLEMIAEKLNEPTAEPQQSSVRHDHTYTVDFKNSKAAITIISLVVGLLASLFINFRQAERNNDLTDSNLKYRYVKMQGKAAPEDIYRLESIFGYDCNRDSIKMIRRQVEQYEQLLKEYNEKQLQIRLNDERALQIEQEAATVKGKQ